MIGCMELLITPKEVCQTALQSVITQADQLEPYIEMLPLQTLYRKSFNGP